MLHVSTPRQDQHDASCTWIFRTSNWWLHIRNFTGCTWMQIVVHTTCSRCQQQHFARPPLGTLQPSHFLQQIFAPIYKQNSKTYLQQKYLPPPATATDQILTGNHFYNSLPKPLLRWHSVVKLFRSSPQIPIRFVFFVAFLGHGLLAVFWCFCEALAVA